MATPSHRATPEAGIALIKRFEGRALRKYVCPAGYWTIGYGHLIKKQEMSLFEEGITAMRAESLLREDLYPVEKHVLQLIACPLSDNQYAALISFAFNLGSGALQSSTLRSKLNRKSGPDYRSAADEFPKWIYGGGKRLKGLETRRAAERMLFLS